MKLTTLNSTSRKTGNQKITNLKKMIQSAAN